MDDKILKKVEFSNKIFSYFSGFSTDLLFWASINTIFFTVVKNFDASDINMLSSIAVLSTILMQGIVFKIIKKIGNIKSIRVGFILLLIANIMMTFSKSFWLVSIGMIIYNIAFFFTNMLNVILKKDLKAVNREEDFSKIISKSNFIYAIITMIISFVSGFLFNVNQYLPMIISIIFSILIIISSFFIYEYKEPLNINISNEKEVKALVKSKNKIKFSKLIILIIASYALLYATVATIQDNSKLFIQYKLQNYRTLEETTIVLSIIIALSRIARVIANAIYPKLIKIFKDKLIVIINVLIILSCTLLIIGNLIKSNIIGIILMAIGFCTILFVRDQIDIFTRTKAIENSRENEEQFTMHQYTLWRRIVRFILSILVSFILGFTNLSFVMIMIFVLVILYLIPTVKLYKELKKI